MKKTSIAVWIIVALIIVGVIIWVASDTDENQHSGIAPDEPKDQRSFLKKISDRISGIEKEIATQVEALRLTIEMQEYLERKANRLIAITKFTLGIVILLALGLLMLNGFELWAAILSVSGIVCIAVPFITFVFFKKIMDVNGFTEWLIDKIKASIFRKFKCDPATIYAMQNSVAAKQEAVKVLQTEIKEF